MDITKDFRETISAIEFMRLRPDIDNDIPLPRYMTHGSSGMDIHAAVQKPVQIQPGDIALIPTGFAMAIPLGFEAQIRPRSGLAVKYGVTVVNAPGTIDADYRGEVKAALINLEKKPYIINRSDRIAQMVIGRVFQPEIKLVKKLESTDRNSGGFGHTGV